VRDRRNLFTLTGRPEQSRDCKAYRPAAGVDTVASISCATASMPKST